MQIGTHSSNGSIWKSSDGLDWERIKRHAEFGARGYMDAVFLKNGTMVLTAGQDLFKCYSLGR